MDVMTASILHLLNSNPWDARPGSVFVATGGGVDAERREDQ